MWLTQSIPTAIKNENKMYGRIREQNFENPEIVFRYKPLKKEITYIIRKAKQD